MSSSNNSGLPSHSTEYGLIATTFNSSMFNMLLFGMYSMIYVYTMYIYLSVKGRTRGNMTILAAITVLFGVNIALTTTEWITTRHAFLASIGMSIDGVFVTINKDLAISWAVLVNNCGTLVLLTLADGLLTWRCYHVWGQSIRPIALPVTFILAEVALNLSAIIIACMNNLSPAPNVASLLNHLLSSAIFMSVGSTLITSSLIAYRIYSVSQGSKANQRHTFAAIVDAIVQSAVAYTLISLFYTIQGVVPVSMSSETIITDLEEFTTPLFSITAGAATTIMVARVALAARNPDVAGKPPVISDLEFNGGALSETSQNLSGSAGAIGYAETKV